MKRLLPIIAAGFLWSCGSSTTITDCLLCLKDKGTCSTNPDGSFLCIPRPTPTPAPPTATPGPTNTPTLTPQATATPQATPTQPTATATPQATQTPCSPNVQKVCVASEGGPVIGVFNPNAQNGPTACWTAKTWLEYMTGDRKDDNGQIIPGSAYFTRGDPAEDGDAPGGNAPGHWKNDDGHGNVQLIHKQTARRPNGSLAVDPPFMEQRTVACPTPQATPQATATPQQPGPTPTPSAGCQIPSSCPTLCRWGVSPNPLFTFNGQKVDDARVGGKGHWDTTPHFKCPPPGACNDDNHRPCTSTVPGCESFWRRCEDPRGPTFAVSGPCRIREEEGFGVVVDFTGPGQCSVEACPRWDAKDEYGEPLNTGSFACSSRFVTVR